MPESPGNIEEIHNSLKASLGRAHSDLDQDVVAASKRVLHENITFLPASAPYAMQRDTLRAKYISLNPVASSAKGWGGSNSTQEQQQLQQSGKAMSNPSHSEKNGDTLPSPRVVLFPEEKVKMEWTRALRIGAGLVNMGNTCFFNSTLQCLTYTAPLVNYCFTNDHREKCKKKDFCMMCEIQNHIKNSLDCGGRSIKPHSILQKLRCIARHMKWGRQEDAHEFLRFVVDHLQQSCLNGETKLDQFSKGTTVINQIFGGYLRSQVTCLRCQAKSNTFDPFMDLSLDIKGVNTVEEALAKFVKPETLEQDNAYKCPKCKNKVRAQKRFSIQKPPNVLTLQLNRFDFHRHLSGKINRFIKYPEKINLRNYMSQRQGEPVLYHLYGVLVHSGHSSEHGHYYSYVKSPSKTWYCMNDSVVHQVGSHNVFNADAYVLFYARINKTVSNSNGPGNHNQNQVKGHMSPVKGPFIGPTLPNLKQDSSPMINGIHGKPSSELGTPIKRQQVPSSSTFPNATTNGPKLVPHSVSATALPGSHNKISFPILSPFQKKFQQLQQKEDGKRIVLQIKHGNSTTMEKSPDGKSKVVNGGLNKPTRSALVPYNDDSDSEQENGNTSQPVKAPVSRTSQEKTGPGYPVQSTSLQASGDYHHNQTPGSQKLSLPSTSGSGDFSHISKHNGGPSSDSTGLPSSAPLYKGPSSIAHHPSSSTSNWLHSSKQDQLSSMQTAKQWQAATNKDTDWTPTRAHAHRDNLVLTSSSALETAGKAGIVALDLPVVNMSSSTVSGGKVKATGSNWIVLTQDSAPSPKGSCSSSNSVNSTTEWTVESKEYDATLKIKQWKSEQDKSHAGPSLVNSKAASHDLGSRSPKRQSDAGRNHQAELVKNHQWSSSCKQSTDSCYEQRTVKPSRPIEQLRPVTPIDISDKRPLLASPTTSDTSSKKSKKQKKKHKKFLDRRRDYEELRDDSSSRSDSSLKRKKKYKHKKGKEEKHRMKGKRDYSESDTDSEDRGKHRRGKHSRYSSDSESTGDEDRRCHRERKSDSEDGYEWVEKTIETTGVKDHGKKTKKASIQSWNHHVKDDLAPKKGLNMDTVKSTWDGSRTNRVAASLTGSASTFGNNVLAWDGTKNHIDREIEQEGVNRKRDWSDDYNEEIDTGKVKKVKKQKEDFGFSENPFQNYHSDKHRDSVSSWSQDHSYHQHHDHHYHKKSSQQHWHDHHSHNKHSGFKSYKSHSSNSSY